MIILIVRPITGITVLKLRFPKLNDICAALRAAQISLSDSTYVEGYKTLTPSPSPPLGATVYTQVIKPSQVNN